MNSSILQVVDLKVLKTGVIEELATVMEQQQLVLNQFLT
jgi:hypothetical protein